MSFFFIVKPAKEVDFGVLPQAASTLPIGGAKGELPKNVFYTTQKIYCKGKHPRRIAIP
jgi:hypothetical protein